MDNSGIIITMAYPDTIVMVSEEWFSPFLKFIGIGKKDYLRAGHAALVLINKDSGILEYHDFGRYITSEPNGRVRGRDTDNELNFPLKAEIKNGEIQNLHDILEFLGTHPKLTHGEGKLVASICDEIDYKMAREHIDKMQNRHFIRYAAFIKDACNCARFVTDTLIASTTNDKIKNKLKASKWFTPSTVGNVLLGNTKQNVYEVSEKGEISTFLGSQRSENLRCFLDKLKNHKPTYIGTLDPRAVEGLGENAQWLSGIAAGAWFELNDLGSDTEYRFRRVSPYGHVDCNAVFRVDFSSFDFNKPFDFVHYSNCKFFHLKQGDKVFRFERKE